MAMTMAIMSLCFVLLHISSVIALAAAVDEDAAALNRFKQYLRITSVHPDPDYGPTTEFLFSRGREIGLEVRKLEFVSKKPVVLLTWAGSRPKLPSILLNSHVDVVPAEASKWVHDPFGAVEDAAGNIYARGSQDMKCVGMQYLEAINRLKVDGFKPTRTVHVSFLPDEEIGGGDGAAKFFSSDEFKNLNVGLALDEGLASPTEKYRIFYAERSPWWLIIHAEGAPGHGSKLYENSAMENILKSLESISRYRASQFDMVKAGLAAEGEVISVNTVYLKSGSPTPTGFVMNLQPSEAEAGFDIRMPPFADTAAMEKRISEEWAPASRNLTYRFKQKTPLKNKEGKLPVTSIDSSNVWWNILQEAITKSGHEIEKPEIFPAATDARFVRDEGISAFGFSPMANTPILLHDHNEFLNVREYLQGIEVYQIIINSLASFLQEEDHHHHQEL